MRAVLTVLVAATMLSIPAVAEEAGGGGVGREVDVSFPASRTRLMANGYTNVQRVNGATLHLSALDPQGSEVLLTISSQSGEVYRTDYVHAMDE